MGETKRNKFYYLVIIIIILIVIVLNYDLLGLEKINEEKIDYINLPENFQINVFADMDTSSRTYPGPNAGPRFIEFNNDILFVSVSKQGKVFVLPDKNKDNIADETIVSIDDLNNPHGLAFYKDWLYIAEEDKVIRIKDTNGDLIYEKETIEKLVDLPEGGHWTRTIRIFQDSLYVSVGSSCNACVENDKRRGSIIKCSVDGKNCEIFASGIRNAVGFIFHPLTNGIYATENSRDLLGEDLPPDEINLIEENGHYGWPFCYGNNIPDPKYDDEELCIDKDPSLVDLQAHSAPLGLTFYYGKQFPQEYNGKLFVAYHGSWNRKVPTGYKIVVIDIETKQVEDFAVGWLTDNFKVLGRPVDIIVDKQGSLFVSDDNAGLIYKVTYKK